MNGSFLGNGHGFYTLLSFSNTPYLRFRSEGQGLLKDFFYRLDRAHLSCQSCSQLGAVSSCISLLLSEGPTSFLVAQPTCLFQGKTNYLGFFFSQEVFPSCGIGDRRDSGMGWQERWETHYESCSALRYYFGQLGFSRFPRRRGRVWVCACMKQRILRQPRSRDAETERVSYST